MMLQRSEDVQDDEGDQQLGRRFMQVHQVARHIPSAADGQPAFIRIKYAVVYVQQPEGWRMVLWHAQKQASAE